MQPLRWGGGLKTLPLWVTCKSVDCTGLVGTGISSCYALLFTLSLATDLMASVGSWTSLEVLHSPDIRLAGGPKLVGATPGELSATGLVLAHNGSLLLRRCLLFLLKTSPLSVLTSYDLTSTCCSTRFSRFKTHNISTTKGWEFLGTDIVVLCLPLFSLEKFSSDIFHCFVLE